MSPPSTHATAAVFCFGLVVLWAMGWVAMTHPNMPFPDGGMDEKGHASYVHHLIRNERWFPDFQKFYMEERSGSPQENDALNYINHPPLFYWVMEGFQRLFPNLPDRLIRLPCFLFYMMGTGIYAATGFLARFRTSSTLVYLVTPCLLLIPQSSVYYNNDSMALLGGAVVVFSVMRILQSSRAGYREATLLGLGFLLASVKLNSLLLCGLFCLALIPHILPRMRHAPWLVVWTGCLVVLALLPYIYFLCEYGSPVPDTPGQKNLLQTHSDLLGWSSQPRLSFLDYFIFSLGELASWLQFPLASALILTGLLFSLLRQASLSLSAWPGQENFILIARATCLATFVTFFIHLAFSYQRHEIYGWRGDWYLRYYFSLWNAYALSLAFQWERLSRKES